MRLMAGARRSDAVAQWASRRDLAADAVIARLLAAA